MKIRTLPVYSKLAEEIPAELAKRLPVNADRTRWQLSQHQVETFMALVDRNGSEVIFNTAMTGDGKSLAGQLPTLVKGLYHPLFAMYPTNELIRDQQRQVQSLWQRWQLPQPITLSLDSAELDRRMESGDYDQRGEALMGALRNTDIVLTNPDIFHYIMQMFYLRNSKRGDAPDKVFAPLVQKFEQFTFDEFHIFETPQIVSVINALLLILETTQGQRKPFLFQSATPNPLMLEYLARAGLTVKVIEGSYHHTHQNPDPSQWRQILQGCEMNFATGTVEAWLDAHLADTLIPFFINNRPGAKGAIIVNSVAQAKRITARLKQVLKPFDLRVEDNTGLTSRTRRAISYSCDLLVGTSTVDVGVDFQINFLLFESRDAGSFLQRLGRLGRHKEFERDGQRISFGENFVAHALLPPWVMETLFQGRAQQPPLLITDTELNRETLRDAIQSAFPQPATFNGYARQWGCLQSVRVLTGLAKAPIKDQYAESTAHLIERYGATFAVNIKGQFGRYKRLKEEQSGLLDEITAFRGGSYFDCAILDLDEESAADQIKTYDLLSLIANADLGDLTEAEFWSAVDRASVNRKPLERCDPLAFFRLRGFLTERTQWHIRLERDIAEWGDDHFGVAQMLKGITIASEFAGVIPGLNAINQRLERREIPALLCCGCDHPLQLKQRLRLPMLFPVHKFVSRDRLPGVVAFGREALLLEVAIKERRFSCSNNAAMIY